MLNASDATEPTLLSEALYRRLLQTLSKAFYCCKQAQCMWPIQHGCRQSAYSAINTEVDINIIYCFLVNSWTSWAVSIRNMAGLGHILCHICIYSTLTVPLRCPPAARWCQKMFCILQRFCNLQIAPPLSVDCKTFCKMQNAFNVVTIADVCPSGHRKVHAHGIIHCVSVIFWTTTYRCNLPLHSVKFAWHFHY